MSWCAEWMRDWLNAAGRSQLELARLAGVDAGNVSRWIRGHSKPDRDAIAKLTEILPQAEAAALVCAWLRDQMPRYADQLVKVETRATAVGEEFAPADFPEGISQELRKRLIFFSKLAVQNPDIRKILDVCYEAAKRGVNQSH
ncbi:MAG: helix-turn-helix transcriptional regulator [Luteolibacter sp.]|nr:helix-turn-helix transcriptional regulator [Luteolibacter sp.]